MKKFYAFIIGLLVWNSQILANTTLHFATEATYPPFETVTAQGEFVGFDIDIARAICARLKATCQFSNVAWDSLIPSLKLRKYDALIGAMNITPERKREVDFSAPYFANSISFVAPTHKSLEISKAGLMDKTIGVQGGTTMVNYLQKQFDNTIHIKSYASQQDALQDLVTGRVDAVVGDTPLLITWIKQQPALRYQLVGEPVTDEVYVGSGYGIAVRKGNTQLLNDINQALAELKASEEYQKIVEHYFGK